MQKIFTWFLLLTSAIQGWAQPKQFESRGVGGGGALFSPVINPDNHNEYFMACDMSEIYHSVNKGQSWSLLNFTTIQGGHNSKMQFTNDANIRYCIDYTSKDGIDYTRPVKSTDGGKTWKLLAGNPYPTDAAYHLTADYNNPNRLILAFYGEIYFSKDGGNSFTKIYTCISNSEGNHVAGVFFNGNDIYLGLNDGLLKSADGGTKWAIMPTTGIPAGEKMLSFSAAKNGSSIRFACLTLKSVWAGIQHAFEYSAWDAVNSKSVAAMQGVYVMDNADGTWKSKLSGIDKNVDFPVFTGMAENDINTIYLSGGSSASAPIVIKSTDGGNNWTHVFLSNGNKNIKTGWSGYQGDRQWSYGECPFGFTVATNDASKVIFTDFGFAHRTDDAGATWQALYVNPSSLNNSNQATPTQKYYQGNGLENTTNWHLLWTDSTHIMASFSDINGVMSADKGKSWKFIPNLTQNSVYHIVKHPTGTLYAATSNIHDMYQSTRLTDNIIDAGKGAVYFSTNNGSSFALMHDFQHPVIWLALDPNNPKRMYASVIHSTLGGIYVSDDIDKGAASTWKKLNQPGRTQGHPFNIVVLKNGHLLVSFSGRRTGSPQQFSASSGIFYSTDGGNTWLDKSDNAMKYWTKDIVIDPSDTSQSTWYAAVFSGWGSAVPAGTGGLYRTKDKGANWTKISNINASYRVNSCSVNAKNPNEMYYTTETDGLWYSNNAQSTNPVFNLVNDYPFRHPVRVNFNPYNSKEIWVSAFGAGMMVSSNSGNTGHTFELAAPTLHLYPNPAINTIHIDGVTAGELEIIDITGKTISTQTLNSGSFNISNLKNGRYYVILKVDNKYQYASFLKQ